MPSFGAELDRRCAQSVRALGRELRGDEIDRLEGELFEQWIAAGRLDELIRSVLARFGTDGGQPEIITLAHHLRKTGDAARIHALFEGLLSRRVRACYRWWKQAETGHLGAMQAAARAAAEAMDAYIEYFHSLHALGGRAGRGRLRWPHAGAGRDRRLAGRHRRAGREGQRRQ